jgi:hypothetical protein
VLSKIAPGNFVLGFLPPAIGPGAMQRPCKSRPLGASLRLAPACGQRLGDFLPDWRSLRHLCGRNVARVLSPPLKSANRRPDDKGWTPWMAARGEARQGCRVEPTILPVSRITKRSNPNSNLPFPGDSIIPRLCAILSPCQSHAVSKGAPNG